MRQITAVRCAAEIRFGRADWTALQRKSVSIRREAIRLWDLRELAPGVYQWTLPYDPFLGYMRGVLESEKAKRGFLNY